MTQQNQHELIVNARDLNLIDLDFPECAVSLNKYIADHAFQNMESIVLDLRWCVVIYSQAHVFLNGCFSKLLSGESSGSKTLLILTTDNYTTRELTCYELFRTTSAVSSNEHDPKSVASAVDRYCQINNLNIEIRVFSGDTEDPLALPLCSYEFASGGN